MTARHDPPCDWSAGTCTAEPTVELECRDASGRVFARRPMCRVHAELAAEVSPSRRTVCELPAARAAGVEDLDLGDAS